MQYIFPARGSTALRFLVVLHIICIHLNTNAQSTDTARLLTANEAVALALAQNYDIRLANGDLEIATLNNTKGNAGMLPTVNLVANENFTLSTFQQRLSNGNEFNALGAPFNVFNTGVQLNWPLFDGRRMFITKKRLEAVEALGSINLQQAVLQTTAAVLQNYYEVARNRLQERAIREIIVLNEERLRIAEARLAAGLAAQTDALQARIDVNQRRSDLIAQQNTTATAKRNLNQLLARDPNTPFEVVEALDNQYQPNREQLLAGMLSQNPALLALRQNMDIAALVVQENAALNKPRINGIGQFQIQRSDNGAGFLLNNTQAGITVGGGLVLPLYAGGNFKRQVDVAKVNARQASDRLEAQQLSIQTQLDNQLAFYETQRRILALETENVTTARENLNISTERFRLGQTNALEVQTGQNTLEQALFRANLAGFSLKVTEVQLRFLAGML
jgi:outer membrane protein